MKTQTSTSESTKPRVPRAGIAILASLLAFGAATATASTVLSAGDDSGDGAGPVTERQVVAAGDSKTHGRWELTSARTANGDLCVGIRLPNSTPPEPAFAEACGGEAIANQVGSIVGPKKSLFFGQVADEATAVKIRKNGKEHKADNTIKGNDGKTYVLTTVERSLSDSEVSLMGADGLDLGRVDPSAKDKNAK